MFLVPSPCHAAHDSAQKACNSCFSPKDVIYNVAAGGGCNLEWLFGRLTGMCGICSLHFVAFYVVGLGRRVVCAIFFASPLPQANGVAYFQGALKPNSEESGKFHNAC